MTFCELLPHSPVHRKGRNEREGAREPISNSRRFCGSAKTEEDYSWANGQDLLLVGSEQAKTKLLHAMVVRSNFNNLQLFCST
jgi:hypothetical protein